MRKVAIELVTWQRGARDDDARRAQRRRDWRSHGSRASRLQQLRCADSSASTGRVQADHQERRQVTACQSCRHRAAQG